MVKGRLMAAYEYITLNGVIVPDTADVLTLTQNDYKTVFGTNLNVDPATPQGLLISSDAQAKITFLKNNAAVANQINPDLAGGIFLDAICNLTALKRDASTYSIVQGVTCAGVAGTVLLAGQCLIQGNDNNLFSLINTVTFDSLGNGTGDFIALEPGPIAALTNTLTQIVEGPDGWETVTNPLPATLGTIEQSDVSLRAKRKQTLGLQGSRLPLAIKSALAKVPGYVNNSFLENVDPTTQIISGVTLIANSIYVCVDGGSDLDVANILLEKKGGGTNWSNGAGVPVTVNITDPFSLQVYAVKFDRPTLVPILARVTVSQNTSVANLQQAVKQAILDYAAGNIEGQEGFTVNMDISAFELGHAINAENPGIFVRKVEISTTVGPPAYTTDVIPIAKYEKATIQESSITVVII